MVAEQQAESKVKRVWILGAGFSRPLGGPLLDDLFTMRGWRQVSYLFPRACSIQHGQMSEELAGMLCIYLLYQHGRKFPDGSLFGFDVLGMGENLYQHAEDFLVKLEMLTPQELWSRLRQVAADQIGETWHELNRQDEFGHVQKRRDVHNKIVDQALDTLQRGNHQGSTAFIVNSAKRLMAYECSAFHVELIEAYKNGGFEEAYLPYRRLGVALRPGEDVLVSFNYDLVVEIVVRPTQGVELYKLHGSVHEMKTAGGGIARTDESYDVFSREGYLPNIKTPGRSKADMDAHDIHIWTKAGAAIRDAQTVIFLGYGLPESDAYARFTILDSLRNNQSPILNVEIVLGESTFRTRRLRTMIQQTLGHRNQNREWQDGALQNIRFQEEKIEQFVAGSHPLDTAELKRFQETKRALEKELEEMKGFRGLNVRVTELYAQDYMAALPLPTPDEFTQAIADR